MNSVATRIAQTADSGINLIRFMTGFLHETLWLRLLGAILRWNYFTRSTSVIDRALDFCADGDWICPYVHT